MVTTQPRHVEPDAAPEGPEVCALLAENARLRAQVEQLEGRVRTDAERRRALLHIMSDLHDTNTRLADQRKAMLHILVDYEQDRRRLARQTERLDNARRALLHILQDVHRANQRLEQSRKAMIHIMGDLRQTEEALRRAHDELEQRVRDRTAALTQANARLRQEMAERQQAEAQLRQQQEILFQHEKLAAMGSLLASVAHELQNPLSIVMVQAELLWEEIPQGPMAEQTQVITQSAERCARIVRNFLTLARQHPPERQWVDLNHVVQEAVELLTYALQVDTIEVALQLAPDLPVCAADPHQLHQVVINLVTNAHQALREVPHPRRLTFTTDTDPARTHVVLEVADTGPGMRPEIQDRIFEPFFTTKPPGVGTGLGLPLCRGIIEGHEGTLQVQSQPGQGTVFRLELPVGDEPRAEPAAPAAVLAPAPAQAQAMLVVDDEPMMASALADLLRRSGYVVDTAANGRVALDKLQERPYDLILCDLRMPELDGPGLYRALEACYPQLRRRVIFLTGDTLSPAAREFLETAGVAHLSKPFRVAEVRRAVRQALQAL
jgi:C4-dicarboxylate-specific signal transduction histidine kinase